MERKRKLFVAKAAVILATIPILLWAHEYGPDPGYCGVPNENGGASGTTCANSQCHLGTANAPANKGSVSVNFPNGMTYVPGVKQHLTVTIADPAPTQSAWGFQLTARSAATPATMAGTFTSTDANTQVNCSQANLFVFQPAAPTCPANEPLEYAEHTLAGYTNSRGHTGSFTYSFDWTPPATSIGNITFYVAGNAATSAPPSSGNANPNDHIYSAKFTLTPGAPPYTCSNTTAPVISSIDSASAYGGYSYFASGSWLEIKGTNLADPADPRMTSANPGQWTGADFSGSNAPTNLDGISVSINGKPAYVWYLSPGQLNVQAPEDTATGSVAITVTNCKATSVPFTFARQALAPGFLAPSNYTAGGTPYMVATLASDPTTYILDTTVGAGFGLKSRPAKPGELIIGYGVGFGDVTPTILPGVIVGQANALANPITVSFGSTNAGPLVYSGLAANFVGLYEFYITVPSTLANGDYQINVKQNTTAIPQTMFLTVHN
jgi:uncharacterized protein (TIGR03437 family)